MNLSSTALITLTTVCHLNNQQTPMIHVPRSCRVPFITDAEPVYSWLVLFVQNKQGICCINNARWVSCKPKYKGFEPIQNHICLKEVEKVESGTSVVIIKYISFIYNFQEYAGELFRMDPTTHVGHQISDVDSLNCSSEESLSQNHPLLLRVFL